MAWLSYKSTYLNGPPVFSRVEVIPDSHQAISSAIKHIATLGIKNERCLETTILKYLRKHVQRRTIAEIVSISCLAAIVFNLECLRLKLNERMSVVRTKWERMSSPEKHSRWREHLRASYACRTARSNRRTAGCLFPGPGLGVARSPP